MKRKRIIQPDYDDNLAHIILDPIFGSRYTSGKEIISIEAYCFLINVPIMACPFCDTMIPDMGDGECDICHALYQEEPEENL